MTTTKIEWTDATWNPIIGCSRVSPGCQNCYAERMSHRLAAMGIADLAAGRKPGRKLLYVDVVRQAKGTWNGNTRLVKSALADPMHWRKPRRVFVNSMSDLFHETVDEDWIDQVFAVMAKCPQHTFQVLTKRPGRMAAYFDEIDAYPVVGSERLGFTLDEIEERWPLPNVWLGTSVEDQERADERIPELLKCPAAVRFLSIEPLLALIELRGNHLFARDDLKVTGEFRPDRGGQFGVLPRSGAAPLIGWVIVGGESGPGARPMDLDWARAVRTQCQTAGVPFFFKQCARKAPIPDDLLVREFPLDHDGKDTE